MASAVECQALLCNSRCYLVLLLFMSGGIVYRQANVNTESIQPRSVNLALDTILEFNNKDKDIQIIDNVQGFLNKIKHVLRDKNGRRSMADDLTFTDFLIKFFEIIKEYQDEDLEDVVAVLDDEIRKYHYVGCKFYELLQNAGMRRFVGRKLDETKAKDAKILRSDFQTYIQMLKDRVDAELNEFFAYINSLYSKEAKPKMRKFLKNLELYKSKSKRANLGLIKIIREGVREIVFDHYTNLNVNARRDFKIRLETFWKNFVDPNKVEHKIWNVKYNKSINMGVRSGISSPMYSIFKNDVTSTEKSTDAKIKKYNDLFKDSLYTKIPLFNIKRDGVEKTKTTKDDGIFMNDLFSLIRNPMKPEPKRIDDKLFGSFSDDVTNKNIVKEFEKSIDLRIPEIPKIVKDRFDSSKDKIWKTKQELLKDMQLDFEKDDFTTKIEKAKDKIMKIKPELFKDPDLDFEKHDYTTKKEKVKHKTKLRDKKHKTPKRFSIVNTEGTTKPLIYDSLDMSNVVETITEIYTTRKHKPKGKRKRKDTKTTRSRFMTLYTEHHKEYTTKVKRTKKEKIKKHKAHKLKKDKDRVGDKKDKSMKMRDMTIGDYEEITDKTKKAKKYREKHEKSKHMKRKRERKHIIRSDTTTKKSRKVLNLRTPESSEGMSIESFEQRSYRKNIDFDNFKQNITTREYNDSIVKLNNNVTEVTTKQMTNLNVTKPVASTFERLDYWPGTTKSSSATETTILPNSTIEETTNSKELNDTYVPRSIGFNKTFETGDNETMRFIDANNIEYITPEDIKLPNTTDAKITTVIDKEEPTKISKEILSKSTTAKPAILRRSISITRRKPKITTVQTTEPPETTESTEVMFKENTTAPFLDVVKFLNKSEGFEDGRRQNSYREKILQDMKNIFFPTTTSTTSTQSTQIHTDPFDEIENALGIE